MGPVFLLNMGIVIFLVGPRSGEGHLLRAVAEKKMGDIHGRVDRESLVQDTIRAGDSTVYSPGGEPKDSVDQHTGTQSGPGGAAGGDVGMVDAPVLARARAILALSE